MIGIDRSRSQFGAAQQSKEGGFGSQGAVWAHIAVRQGGEAGRVAGLTVGNASSTKGGKVLNKKELIDSIADATGESKRLVNDVLDTTITKIQQQVKKGERVSLPGFGTFERRNRSARTARNPRTGEEIKVPATKVPAFKPGSSFKDLVSGR